MQCKPCSHRDHCRRIGRAQILRFLDESGRVALDGIVLCAGEGTHFRDRAHQGKPCNGPPGKFQLICSHDKHLASRIWEIIRLRKPASTEEPGSPKCLGLNPLDTTAWDRSKYKTPAKYATGAAFSKFLS